MEILSVILLVVGVLALGFLGNLSTDVADQKRITKDVELNGGSVISIESAAFDSVWSNNYDRTYIVCYSTRSGKQSHALCKTSKTGSIGSANVPPGLMPG